MSLFGVLKRPKLVSNFSSERAVIVKNLSHNLRFFKRNNIHTIKLLNDVKLRKILDTPLWGLLEFGNKYDQPFISREVLNHANEIGIDVLSTSFAKKVHGDKNIQIELDHVVPRAYLIDQLLTNSLNADRIEFHLIACVITREEHLRLPRSPSNFSLSDPWKYYRENHIEVFDRITGDFLDLSTNSKDAKLRNLIQR